MPIELDPGDPVFTIGVAAKLTRLSHKQLRVLESKGIVTPARTDHGHRLYSLNQLDVLRYVAYLVATRKVNVAGVRVVLDLFEKLPEDEQQRVLQDAESSVPAEPAVALTPILEADSEARAAEPLPDDEEQPVSEEAGVAAQGEPCADMTLSSDAGPPNETTRTSQE